MPAKIATPEVVATGTATVGFGQHSRVYLSVEIAGRVYVVAKVGGQESVREICGRCDGRGDIAVFGHVYQGECFSCGRSGLGKGLGTLVEAAEVARKRLVREARAAAKHAEERAAYAAKEAVRMVAVRDADHDAALREDARREAAKAVQDASRYVGSKGSKVTVTGTVGIVRTFDTDYGPKCLVIVNGTGTDAGVTLKLSGTAAVLWELEEGEAVSLLATVKEHAEYQGVRQTVGTRPKRA